MTCARSIPGVPVRVRSGTAYYNENEPYAAQWLRNLIDAGHIAPGVVDDRDIRDVTAGDLRGFTQCHFFAGIGVWSYALRRAGWPDDRPVWTGSCPCQPFSGAGRRAGFDDDRHLWPAWFNLIDQCRPDAIFGEQVDGKDGAAWLNLVQADLERSDYACGAVVTPAAGYGAPHGRHRIYFVADSDGFRRTPGERDATSVGYGQTIATDRGTGHPGPVNGFWRNADWLSCTDGKWRAVEPGTFPLATRHLGRVGKLRAYGNAIVAPQAEEFIKIAMELIH